MKCFDCGGELKQSTRLHVVELKNCIIIVKNVPCLECEQCGETVYNDDVAKRLDEIIEAMSDYMAEIAVVDFTAGRVA